MHTLSSMAFLLCRHPILSPDAPKSLLNPHTMCSRSSTSGPRQGLPVGATPSCGVVGVGVGCCCCSLRATTSALTTQGAVSRSKTVLP